LVDGIMPAGAIMNEIIQEFNEAKRELIDL
jgi:hypothetical protein